MKNDTTKLPYFKFMVQDWLSGDLQASEMRTQGVFMNLVALMWRDGGVYSKPMAVLCTRCRLPLAELEKELDMLKELGVIYVDDDGYLRVKFVDEQLGELTQDHEQKVVAGKLGAAKRWGKQTHSTAIAPPCHIDKDTDIDTKKAYSDSFERCWKAYPNTSGSKKKAFDAFKRSGASEQDVLDGIGRYKAHVEAERRGGFKELKYANGQTWFNGNNWESEYEVEGAKSKEELDLIEIRKVIN